MFGVRRVQPCPGWIVLANSLDRECELVSVGSCRRNAAEARSGAARRGGIKAAPVNDQKVIACIEASPLRRSDAYFGGCAFKIRECGYGVCSFIP